MYLNGWNFFWSGSATTQKAWCWHGTSPTPYLCLQYLVLMAVKKNLLFAIEKLIFFQSYTFTETTQLWHWPMIYVCNTWISRQCHVRWWTEAEYYLVRARLPWKCSLYQGLVVYHGAWVPLECRFGHQQLLPQMTRMAPCWAGSLQSKDMPCHVDSHRLLQHAVAAAACWSQPSNLWGAILCCFSVVAPCVLWK